MDAADPSTAYADVLGEVSDRLKWPPLLAAEGKGTGARRKVDEICARWKNCARTTPMT